MHPKKSHVYSARMACWGLVCLLAFSAVLAFPAQIQAAGCFPDLYYKAMFKPVAQQANEDGDNRLVGMSDFLAAKGKDHCEEGGSGCMCGVNNGRWDQILLNRSNRDLTRVPVTFKINAITARLFDRQGKAMNTGFEISLTALENCMDGALNTEDFSPWRLGQLKKANILEPGENILGCICLKPADRDKSGFVELKVDYTTVIPAYLVPSSKARIEVRRNHMELTDNYPIESIAHGSGRYFRIMPPPLENCDRVTVIVALENSENLDLFTSPVWHGNQSQWKKGMLKAAVPDSGSLWVLVRSSGRAAQGSLMVRLIYQFREETGQMTRYKSLSTKLEQIEVGPSGTRTFKSYVLGLGSKTRNVLETTTQRPCCDGMR